MTKECTIHITSVTDAEQYQEIEQIFNSFKGHFEIKKEDSVFNVYTDELGRLLYDSIFSYTVEHSIAFLV